MTSTVSERDLLIPAIDEARARWKDWQRGKSLLGSYPAPPEAIEPISKALENCSSYQNVAGRSLFSGCSGVVLAASTLAYETLYHADRPDSDAAAAADWVLLTLRTHEAAGTFTVAIWGLSIDRAVDLGESTILMPFQDLADTSMTRRVKERAREAWDKSVWHSQSLFDVPGAAIVRKVVEFPYIGDPAESFRRLYELEFAAAPSLTLLQGLATGSPVVAASWFEYENQDLDFNRMENYLAWMMPEIVPRVRSHVGIDGNNIARTAAAFWALPEKWKQDLLRSMKRFTLSQCRHDLVDQVLDLAIAFEIAMHGEGEGPMSWKAAVRTAQVIGGALEARQEARKGIEELFKLRNKGAHGSSMQAVEREKYVLVLARAKELYRLALNAFLELGRYPDWKSLELEPRTAL